MSEILANSLFTPEEICLASRLVSENPPLILKGINNKLKKFNEENVCGYIPNPFNSIQRIAQLIHKESLGQEDLFYLLTHPKENLKNPQDSMPLLRKALDYPPEELKNVELAFHTIPFREDGQIAYITLTPSSIDPEKPPLIFLGGVDHKSALYLSTLSELSKQDHRKIISIDLPSLGGSRLSGDQKVNLTNLLEATSQVIQQEIPEGQRFDLMGHSLGTLILRKIYSERESYSQRMRRTVGKFVLVAPAPAEQEEAMGIHPCWSCSPNFQDSWRESRAALEAFAANAWSSASLVKNIDSLPILGELEKDKNLRVVFPEKDHLFPLYNLRKWRGRQGVFIVKNADHSFLAGQKVSGEEVKVLLDALQDSAIVAPLIDKNQLYRHSLHTSTLGGLSMDTRAGIGTQLTHSLKIGLWRGESIGVDVQLGFSAYLHFYDWRKQSPALWMGPHTDLGLKFLNWPVRLHAGALLLMDDSLLVGDPKNGTLLPEIYTGVEIAYKKIFFQLQLREPVWSNQSGLSLPSLYLFLSFDQLLSIHL